MVSRCVLETEGFRISLELEESLYARDKNVDLRIEFSLHSRTRQFSITAPPTFILIKDIRDLVIYFDEHIKRLKQDPDSISPLFLPLSVAFKMQAFAGDIVSESEGEFTILFLVNMGTTSEEGANTYLGGEALVSIKNIKRFTSELYRALAIIS
jgi:hypothetical protein